MKKRLKPFREPYDAPDTSLVFYETGCALCETSGEGGEIEPGESDPWGNF